MVNLMYHKQIHKLKPYFGGIIYGIQGAQLSPYQYRSSRQRRVVPVSENLYHLPPTMGGEYPKVNGHIFTGQCGGSKYNPGITLPNKGRYCGSIGRKHGHKLHDLGLFPCYQ